VRPPLETLALLRLALAQAPEIDAILVTELSRWGRSTHDPVQTLAMTSTAGK
jgi:DNA invertase Pin-like site-specific DNA recombinase